MIVIDCEQRSDEWRKARLGRLCGSRAADMLAMKYPEPLKSGEPSKAKPTELAGRRNLRAQLVLERITGKSGERGFESQAMKDGVDREPDALLMYEALTGQLVTRTGFIAHDTLQAGCSLDGHLGDFDLIVEAKCPIPATHLEYLETGVVPGEYLKQINHDLWITGARACDWLSYQPDFPEELQIKMVRVMRDDSVIADYERKARAFLAEVDRKVESVEVLRLRALAVRGEAAFA